jgi:hypothetical protein
MAKQAYWIVERGVAHKLATDPTALVRIAFCGKSEWGRGKVTNRRKSKVCPECQRVAAGGKPATPKLADVAPVVERQLGFLGDE